MSQSTTYDHLAFVFTGQTHPSKPELFTWAQRYLIAQAGQDSHFQRLARHGGSWDTRQWQAPESERSWGCARRV